MTSYFQNVFIRFGKIAKSD